MMITICSALVAGLAFFVIRASMLKMNVAKNEKAIELLKQDQKIDQILDKKEQAAARLGYKVERDQLLAKVDRAATDKDYKLELSS